MLGMHDEAKIVAVAVASALIGALAPLCSRAGSFAARAPAYGVPQLAAGDLSARASESGPRELVELEHPFNEMASNIEQLFDARRELVAWASHDLRRRSRRSARWSRP